MNVARRLVMTLAVLLIGVAFAFAGGSQQKSSSTSTSTSTQPAVTTASSTHESPMLDALVKAGKLPPLNQRLPSDPLVLKPFDQIGKYGGTLHRTYLGPTDGPAFTRLSADGLLRLTVDGQKVIPNIATSWDVSSDGKSVTVHLRHGMKWSDGQPFTADDLMFWYQAATNKDLAPTLARVSLLNSGGQMGKMEKIDDYTVRFSFAAPYPLFVHELATPSISTNGIYPFLPKHYMKQFFPAYTDMATLNKMAKEAGYTSWTDLFIAKADDWNNPDYPVVSAWKITNKPGATRMIADRNPYYWKVDPDGNQLPYIDHVALDLIQNQNLLVLRAAGGQIDYQARGLQLSDYTVLKQNEAKGNYTVLTQPGDRAADVALYMNGSYTGDSYIHELMNNVKFKQALSISFDRNEINKLFYLGLGKPRSVDAISSDPAYDANVANMNIQYDPAKANQILDSIGLTKKNADGIRLRPDGKPISLTLYTCGTTWPNQVKVAQVILAAWKKIGIDGTIKDLERAEYYNKSQANQMDVEVFTAPGTTLSNNWWLFPQIGTHNDPAYGLWYRTNGKQGTKPPDGSKVLAAMNLYRKAMTSSSMADVISDIKQILLWGNEDLWAIGVVGEIPQIAVLSNNLVNVPKDAPFGTHLGTPGNMFAEQWSFK